jgi:hypothetical protein
MKADARGRIRFTEAGFRFEISVINPTKVTIYSRSDSSELKLGTVDLIQAGLDLVFTGGDGTVVKPITAVAEPVGVGGYF